MTRSALGSLLVATSLLSSPSFLQAQSAGQIMESARQAFIERMAGIQSYTVTQSVMGIESTVHYVRSEVDGFPVFRPEIAGGAQQPADQGADFDSGMFFREDVAARTTLGGQETVNGQPCQVLSITNFEGLDLAGALGAQQGFEPRSMSMCVDSDDYLVQKVDMEGTLTGSETPQEVTSTVTFSDYRTIDGMIHPFRIEVATTGLAGAMSSSERSEAAEALEQMRRQLESMPEAQRRMVEEMMRSQMATMEAIVAGQPVSIVIETSQLLVNTGGS